MGVEAFGVSMRLVETGVSHRLKEVLTSHDHVRMYCGETVSGFETITGEYDDGTHFIDLQIRGVIASSECSLAIRFSLCSYDSIDAIFIALVRDILSSWEAEVWLMTSALRQKNVYLPGDSAWLIAALPDEIVEMRIYWQKLFGSKQGAVRVKDSFLFAGVKSNV
jgi:hypothetical protein